MKVNIQKLKDCVGKIKEFTPEILTVSGMAACMMPITMGYERTPDIYKALYAATGSEYFKIRLMQTTHTNNWLKMHGYPMKRKI